MSQGITWNRRRIVTQRAKVWSESGRIAAAVFGIATVACDGGDRDLTPVSLVFQRNFLDRRGVDVHRQLEGICQNTLPA